MFHLDLFSGIGLFSYAADHVWDLEHVFCEIEPWCHKFLRQKYPNARVETDVRKFDASEYAGRTFLLTAGVPCQPASVAGKRKGTSDDRWLWPEALRVLGEAKPEWAIFENPNGILTLESGLVFENLCVAMENEGYEVQPYIIPACAVGAIHRRDRVWIVSHSKSSRFKTFGSNGVGIEKSRKLYASHYISNASNTTNGKNHKREFGIVAETTERREGINSTIGISNSDASDTKGTRLERTDSTWQSCSDGWFIEQIGVSGWPENWPEIAARICRADVSSPDRIHRLKALGNTIQWEVAYQIMKAIDLTFF